jgi:pimeloyl-ACP methyl ester carboxylesterase
VLVGWSAGVEIIQVFNHYFPVNVTGMAYIDGYPNYRVLEAITKHMDDSYVTASQSELLGTLWLIRNLEPFGAGAIVGGTNTFLPEEMKDYYRAYYRNNYFWYSQYQEVRNPNDLTSFLTKLGDDSKAAKPYPFAKVNLNWPDVTVPLLLMPANSTVYDPNSGNQYMTQMEKYQTKATNAIIDTLPGTHSIVYELPN